MLVCRPRHLAALLLRTPPARSTSATASSSSTAASTSQSADNSEDSIFTAPESPWDHVFSDISPPTPQLHARLDASNATASTSLSGRKKGRGQYQSSSASQGLVQRSSGVRNQRASLTAREMSVFDEMFDMIFNAVSAHDGKKVSSSFSSSAARSPASPASVSSSVPSISGQAPGIGHTGAPLNDLFRTLRRRSRVRWTTAIDEELDRKKETMELFNTDYDLLQWVTKEIFGEAQQWDEVATKAMAAGATKDEGKGKDAATASVSPTSFQGGLGKHSIYPHLIAHAMRIFRTTYSNPSLSLAIFNHAARISIPSYVFGCTAPAYNELIEAKWEGWGDLEGVCNALEEMRANGVKIDGRTRIVVEKVRREVGEARPVELGLDTGGEDGHANLDDEKDVNPLARRVWEEPGEAEVIRLIHRIEYLALRYRSRNLTSSAHEESWKNVVLQPTEDDGWSFDSWDMGKKAGDTKKRRKVSSQTVDDWSALDTPELAFR